MFFFFKWFCLFLLMQLWTIVCLCLLILFKNVSACICYSSFHIFLNWIWIWNEKLFSNEECFPSVSVANAGAVECLPSANPTSWLQGVRRFEEVKALCMEMDVMISPVWWNMKMYFVNVLDSVERLGGRPSPRWMGERNSLQLKR